jgi:hypothetical protein
MTESSNKGLLAAGISLLATGYVPALICGALFGPITPSSGIDAPAIGGATSWTLLIPVLGPFVSGIIGANNLAWSLPWVFADGAMQVAGLAMIVAGARDHHKVPVILENARFTPYAAPGGGGMMMTGRF